MSMPLSSLASFKATSENGLKLAVRIAHSIFEKRMNGLSELIDHRVIIPLRAQRVKPKNALSIAGVGSSHPRP